MKLPLHVNPVKEIALAPYNFVPLPDQIITFDPQTLPDQDRYHPDRHTGYIECVITTESPVYVRAPLTPEEFERQEAGQDNTPWRQQVRNKPDFFYADLAKTPRIPGSSLRGMLRQIVEIISYSKVQWVSEQPLVYRAVGDTTSHGEKYRNRIMKNDGQRPNRSGKPAWHYTPLVKAGYIEEDRGEYFIRPAREIGGTTFARIRIDSIPGGLKPWGKCKNASEIWFQPGQYDYQDVRGGFLRIKYAKVVRASAQPAQGLIKGALVRSGPMASKRSEAVIYPPDEKAERIEIPDELVAAYKDQVSQEQEHLLGKNGVLRDEQPVFYLMENGRLVFFGHTMMMRLPYLKTPHDFVPESLRRESDLDLADAIFGYTKSTGEGKARAYASRVFVSDAVLEPDQSNIWLSEEPIVPKILGSPKPTTFQHYLTQPAPDPQEQGRDRSGNPKYVKELADYADHGKSVIRGHKLYWHKGTVTAADLQEALDRLRDAQGREKDNDTQHTQMRPVAAGVRFRWRILFENLSDEELGALLWALTLPGEPGREYRHSIGMGKPLGMGAIKIDARLMLENRQQRYATLFDGDAWQTGLVQADDRIPEFVSIFDRLIRERIGEASHSSLAKVERTQMLLRMLEWPGPNKELTRYMEIERQDPRIKRGKINEYKGRPVLPDPLHVDPASRRTASSVSRSSAETTVEISRPASIQEVREGMYLEGRVVRVERDRVVVDILGQEASLSRERLDPPGRDIADMQERFPVGKTVRAWVVGFSRQGRLQLTMRKP
ncbi:MAG: TIGR03986 family CRISPR-associated RAMP protein [Roseiflexaceae bacterium]|nr:TIGR03986 family CRISPR-associated RAMP protein [Roseiflexaceae bacterium]